MTPIEQAIRDADLSAEFNTKTGDCASIALAIHDVFGGHLVGVYAAEDATGPAHVAVEINNVLYDGDGRTSYAVLYGLFVPHTTEPEDTAAVYRGPITALDELCSRQATREAVRDRLLDATAA